MLNRKSGPIALLVLKHSCHFVPDAACSQIDLPGVQASHMALEISNRLRVVVVSHRADRAVPLQRDKGHNHIFKEQVQCGATETLEHHIVIVC
jgi:hypothetical protein